MVTTTDDFLAVVNCLRSRLANVCGKLRVTDALTLANFDRPSFLRVQLVGRAMRELGWERGRYRFNGTLSYAYARGSLLEREVVLEVARGDDGQIVVQQRKVP